MSEGLLAALILLSIAGVGGVIHNAIKVARVETKIEPMWSWWNNHHKGEK
jgi:hypothetical protein